MANVRTFSSILTFTVGATLWGAVIAPAAAQNKNVDADPRPSSKQSGPSDREVAQRHVDLCVDRYESGPKRDSCLTSTGYELFDEHAGQSSAGCIPFCVCVVAEGCPCCDIGDFGGWIFNPTHQPYPSVPTGATREPLDLRVDAACVETDARGQRNVELHTTTSSKLAPLVDFDFALPAAGIVAASLSDRGGNGDERGSDAVFSGPSVIDTELEDGCYELGCHFGCEGEWVYPGPGEGHCPADDWWGIGCLKLTSCSFGCGSESDEVDPGLGVRDGIYTLQQPNSCG